MTAPSKNEEPTKAEPTVKWENWALALAWGWMLFTPGAIIALGWGYGLMATGGYTLFAGWISRRDQVLKMG